MENDTALGHYSLQTLLYWGWGSSSKFKRANIIVQSAMLCITTHNNRILMQKLKRKGLEGKEKDKRNTV